jgi:hypothetical protein
MMGTISQALNVVVKRFSVAWVAVWAAAAVNAQNQSAIEALEKQAADVDQQTLLEEVFDASEENYSLLKENEMSLNYSVSHSYTEESEFALKYKAQKIESFNINPRVNHQLQNNFLFNYGWRNNVTLGLGIPLVAKYEDSSETSASSVGDIRVSMRWQPWAYVPGESNVTFNFTLDTKTGVSPYDISVEKALPTGSGHNEVSAGISWNQAFDPVLVYANTHLEYALPESGLNQVRSDGVLDKAAPGWSWGYALGLVQALSYKVSLSYGIQSTYRHEPRYKFVGYSWLKGTSDFSTLASIGTSFRLRNQNIVQLSLGYGLTKSAPDTVLSFSMPLDIKGWKL